MTSEESEHIAYLESRTVELASRIAELEALITVLIIKINCGREIDKEIMRLQETINVIPASLERYKLVKILYGN